jgi:hypothetical protein
MVDGRMVAAVKGQGVGHAPGAEGAWLDGSGALRARGRAGPNRLEAVLAKDGEAVVADAQGVVSFALLRGHAREKQGVRMGVRSARARPARICAPCRSSGARASSRSAQARVLRPALNDYVAGDWSGALRPSLALSRCTI